MSEKTVVKGGFRSTLALIISIIALILAFMVYNRTGGKADLKGQINDLQDKLTTLKKETAQRINRVGKETARALDKMGIEIRRVEPKKTGD